MADSFFGDSLRHLLLVGLGVAIRGKPKKAENNPQYSLQGADCNVLSLHTHLNLYAYSRGKEHDVFLFEVLQCEAYLRI
jgi:hypothetical protein